MPARIGPAFRRWKRHRNPAYRPAPERWRIFDEDIRRYLTRVFPYAILYTIEPEGYVLVVAVMHCRREPGYWRHRLD